MSNTEQVRFTTGELKDTKYVIDPKKPGWAQIPGTIYWLGQCTQCHDWVKERQGEKCDDCRLNRKPADQGAKISMHL